METVHDFSDHKQAPVFIGHEYSYNNQSDKFRLIAVNYTCAVFVDLTTGDEHKVSDNIFVSSMALSEPKQLTLF